MNAMHRAHLVLILMCLYTGLVLWSPALVNNQGYTLMNAQTVLGSECLYTHVYEGLVSAWSPELVF